MSNIEPVKHRGTVRVPESVVQAIHALVNHYWDEEFAHYSATPRSERNENRHVFQELSTVRRWLMRVHPVLRKKGSID